MRVGQTLELDIMAAKGWSLPRSSDSSVLSLAKKAQGGGVTRLHLTARSPGAAEVLSVAQNCASTDATVCIGSRSGRGFVYLRVTVVG
jgi:hypothetical protein